MAYLNKYGDIIIEGNFPTGTVKDADEFTNDWFSNTLNLDKDELIKLGIIDGATYVDGVSNYYMDDDLLDDEMGKPISKEEYNQYIKDNTGKGEELKNSENGAFITDDNVKIGFDWSDNAESAYGYSTTDNTQFNGEFNSPGNIDGAYSTTANPKMYYDYAEMGKASPDGTAGIAYYDVNTISGVKEVHNSGHIQITPGPTLTIFVSELNKNVSIEDIKADVINSDLDVKIKDKVNDWLDMSYDDEMVKFGQVVIDMSKTLKKGIASGATNFETASSIISIVAGPLVNLLNLDDSFTTDNELLNDIDKVAGPTSFILSALMLAEVIPSLPAVALFTTALSVYSLVVNDEMESDLDWGKNFDIENGTGVLSVSYGSGASTTSHQINIDLNDIDSTINEIKGYAAMSHFNLQAILWAIPLRSTKNIKTAQTTFHNEMTKLIEEHDFKTNDNMYGEEDFIIIKEAYGIDYNILHSVEKISEEGLTPLKKDKYTVFFDVENAVFSRYKNTVDEEISTIYSAEYDSVICQRGYYKSGNIYLGQSSDKNFIDYAEFFWIFKKNYYCGEIYDEANIQNMRDFITNIADNDKVKRESTHSDSYMSAEKGQITYQGAASASLDALENLTNTIVEQLEITQSGLPLMEAKDQEIADEMRVK